MRIHLRVRGRRKPTQEPILHNFKTGFAKKKLVGPKLHII